MSSVFVSFLWRRNDIIFVCSPSVSDLNIGCPIFFPCRWPGKWGMVSGYRVYFSCNKDRARAVWDIRPCSLSQSHHHNHVAGGGTAWATDRYPGTADSLFSLHSWLQVLLRRLHTSVASLVPELGSSGCTLQSALIVFNVCWCPTVAVRAHVSKRLPASLALNDWMYSFIFYASPKPGTLGFVEIL